MSNKVREFLKLLSAFAGKESLPERNEGEDDRYREYLVRHAPAQEELERQRNASPKGPLFTFLMNVEGYSPHQVECTLNSLCAQTHCEWELYAEIQDKASQTANILRRDARVRLIGLPEEGKRPFLEAERLSAGEYFLLITPGDTLPQTALYRFSQYLSTHPDTPALYADEDERNANGERVAPELKPDFGMETLMSYPVIGRPFAVKRALWEQCGGLRGYDAAAEYDFMLRVALGAKKIGHLAQPLYTREFRREVPQAADARESLKRVLREEGHSGYAMSGIWKGSFRVRGALRKKLYVSLIIPGETQFANLRRLLESIDDCTTYDHYELIVVDTGTGEAQLLRYYEALRKHGAARVLPYVGPPSRPAMLNFAAEQARGDALVFLDPDVSMLSTDWLESMLETLFRPGVGAVGPKLLTPDGHIVSAGYVIGLGGWYGSACSGLKDCTGNLRQDRLANTLRNVSALPAECFAVSAERFFSAGKFDESFSRYGFDVEFCLRLAHRSLRCVYTPYAILNLHRPLLPGQVFAADQLRIYDVIRSTLERGDPCYNRNYDYEKTAPVIAPDPKSALLLNPKATQ